MGIKRTKSGAQGMATRMGGFVDEEKGVGVRRRGGRKIQGEKSDIKVQGGITRAMKRGEDLVKDVLVTGVQHLKNLILLDTDRSGDAEIQIRRTTNGDIAS